MSFFALVDNRQTCSLELSKEATRQLKHTNRIICELCAEILSVKQSTRARTHFAHRNDSNCVTAKMSDRHSTAQALIYIAINTVKGWHAHLEMTGKGYRSDVMAIRLADNYRISFEVQLASISREEAVGRDIQQYLDGVDEVIWLHDKLQPWAAELVGARLDYGLHWKRTDPITVHYPSLPDSLDMRAEDHSYIKTELTELVEKILTHRLVVRKPASVMTSWKQKLLQRSCNRWLFIDPSSLEDPEILLSSTSHPYTSMSS